MKNRNDDKDHLPGKLEAINPRLKARHSKRAKRIALRLDHRNHEIHLVIPPRANLKKAFDFAYTHRHWITEKLGELPAPVAFTDGAVLPLLGENVTLDIYCDIALKKTTISLKNNILSVKTNKDDPSGRITRHLKAHAKERLTAGQYQGGNHRQNDQAGTSTRHKKPLGQLQPRWHALFFMADHLCALRGL